MTYTSWKRFLELHLVDMGAHRVNKLKVIEYNTHHRLRYVGWGEERERGEKGLERESNREGKGKLEKAIMYFQFHKAYNIFGMRGTIITFHVFIILATRPQVCWVIYLFPTFPIHNIHLPAFPKCCHIFYICANFPKIFHHFYTFACLS